MRSYLWTHGTVAATVGAVALATLCGAVAGLLTKRLRTALTVGVAALPVTAIVGATLMRSGWPSAFHASAGFDWAPGGWLRFTSDFGRSEEIDLNVVLFAPAGFVLALAARRPLAVTAALSSLSAAIEVSQGVFGLGTPDLSDYLANSIGAAGGALLGAAVACVGSRRRRPYVGLVTLVAVAAVCAALIPIGAARRQAHLEAALAARYEGHAFADYRKWSRAGELGSRVFSVDGVFSTGARQTEDLAVVRYPTSFMGIDQCLTATWTSSGVRYARQSGSFCERFMG